MYHFWACVQWRGGKQLTQAIIDSKLVSLIPLQALRIAKTVYLDMVKNYLLLLLLSLLASCAKIKYPERTQLLPVTSTGDAPINGKYKNMGSDTSWGRPFTLWTALTLHTKQFIPDSLLPYPDAVVELQLQRRRKLNARLINDTQLIEERILKGRIRDGYFSVRRKVRYVGLPFLYLRYSDYKVQLGSDNNRHLLVDAVSSRFGWIFIMSAGTADQYHFQFEKK
ncbi:MAG: hypothetical protein JNM19_08360 [Chitinophagaceae bacterium]|nr:hypothetical protein [Chitinophagaceae bacterium]